MYTWLKVIGLICVGPALLLVLARWRYQTRFPYGPEHCCDKQLFLTLSLYADEHDGHFPGGGETPEASLSLLYPKYEQDADTLRGKGYSKAAAEKLLAAGKPLTPETCGWNYVEGLQSAEKSKLPRNLAGRIALFWDKIGLGHNSEYLPAGGHTVMFLDGYTRVINQANWPRFLADQRKTIAAIRRNETPAIPWIPEETN